MMTTGNQGFKPRVANKVWKHFSMYNIGYITRGGSIYNTEDF